MEEKQPFFKRYEFLFSIGCFLASFLFLFGNVIELEIKYYVEEQKVKEYFAENFINLLNANFTKPMTMIIILFLIGLGLVLILIAGLTKNKIKNEVNDGLVAASIFASLIAICFLFLSKEIFIYFASNENPPIEYFNGASLGWGAAASIACLALSIVFSVSYSSYSEQNSIKVMAEDGLLIATAFVLNLVKLPITVTGGSINFQMAPLMIIALRRGPLHGLVCGGLIYGLLTCLTDGYGFATYPFDYLIGFGSVAVIGFFRKFIIGEDIPNYCWKGELFILLSGIIMTFIRFMGSSISSMVIYGYEFIPALAYNAIYIPVSGAVATGAIMLMYGPIQIISKRFPTNK